MTAPEQVSPGRFEDARRALIFGVASVLMAYWVAPLGLIFGIVALVMGVKALRLPTRRVMAGWSLGLGIAGIVIGLIFTAVQVIFWSEAAAYAECQAKAITHTAEEACTNELYESIARKLGVPAEMVRIS